MPRRSVPLVCLLSLLLIWCAPGPSSGGGFMSSTGRSVVQVPDSDAFEVIAASGDNGRALFCAAGEYANRVLKAGASDRVVLTRPTGPSLTRDGRRAAIFRVTPPGTAPAMPTFTGISQRRAGTNFTVGTARFFCEAIHRRAN